MNSNSANSIEKGPVFIAGAERSGTSLIYALLATHPNLSMSRRTNFWTYFYNQFGDLSRSENFERCLATIMSYKRMLLLKPDPERIRKEFWQGETTYSRLYELLELHFAEKLGRPRWGDKSLNTERYTVPILAAFPNAKIIHMLRDPRDRYASAVTRWKVSRGGIGAGTAVWRSTAALARRNQKMFPNNYRVLRYETLASEPVKTLKEICNFIGEEYTEVMLTMKGAETFADEGGNSSYGQFDPGQISTRSIGRFRKVLSPRQIAFMQTLGKRDMETFDYSLDPVHLTPKEKLLFTFFDLPFEYVRMTAWLTSEAFMTWKGRKLPAYRIVSDNMSLTPSP